MEHSSLPYSLYLPQTRFAVAPFRWVPAADMFLPQSAHLAEKQKEKTNIQEELASLETRNRELDSLIEKLYEDYAARMIGAERMNKLLGKYEAESRDIQNQINATEQKEKFVSPENSDDKLKKLLKAYTEPTELTQEMLYCLIDRIEISQGIYEKTEFGRRKRQTIKIYFRFSGKSMPITYNM